MVRGKRQLGLDGRVPRRVDAGIKDHQGVAFLLGAGRRLLAAPCVPGDGAAGNGAPTSRLPTAAGDLMVEIANDRVDAVASGPGTVTLSPWREIEAELGSAGTQDLLAAVDAQLIKAGKRARYAAELASPVVDGKGTNSCRTSWATTRTGASPAALLRRLVTATAHHSNENGFTYGLLYAHEQHRDTGTTGTASLRLARYLSVRPRPAEAMMSTLRPAQPVPPARRRQCGRWPPKPTSAGRPAP